VGSEAGLDASDTRKTCYIHKYSRLLLQKHANTKAQITLRKLFLSSGKDVGKHPHVTHIVQMDRTK